MRLLALTVVQPWASGFFKAENWKDVENRTWASRNIKPGDWIAIHAGLRCLPHINREHFKATWPDMPELDTLPHGALLGAVRFQGFGVPYRDPRRRILDASGFCTATDTDGGLGRRCRYRRHCSPWACGPVCWCFDLAAPLPAPRACVGGRGLWVVPVGHVQPLEQAIQAVLEAA